MKEKQHHIQLEKCLVVLTSSEIHSLLQKDIELFARALKRGKYRRRYHSQKERERAKNELEKGKDK